MSFPQDGYQSLPVYHDFRVGGVEVRDQYFDLIQSKEFYLGRSIDPSGYLGVWNSLDKPDYGKFSVVTNPAPDLHEVYIDYAIGLMRFSQFETWVSAYGDYISLGSVPMAEGFNQTNRILEDVQAHLLASDGETRLDLIETRAAAASGTLITHVNTHIDAAHPGILGRAKQSPDTLYKDTVQDLDLGFADPSGQRTLREHFTKHPNPYWSQLAKAPGDPTTVQQSLAAQQAQLNAVDVRSAGSSGQLQSHLADEVAYRQNTQDALTTLAQADAAQRAYAAQISGQMVQGLADERAYLVDASGTLQGQFSSLSFEFAQQRADQQVAHEAIDARFVSASSYFEGRINASSAQSAAASGNLQTQIDALKVTDGSLQSQINAAVSQQTTDRQWAVAASGNLQGQIASSVAAERAYVVAASGNLQNQITAHGALTISQAHSGMLLDSQIPASITRDVELAAISGQLQSKIDAVSAQDAANQNWAWAASGNLQGQLGALSTTVSGKESAIASGTTAQVWRGDKKFVDLAQWVADQPSVSGVAAKAHTQNTDTGTNSATFQLAGGVKLKNSSGALEVRNAADNAYADLTVQNLTVQGTMTTVNSETLNVADNLITLNSNVMTGTPTENGGIELLRGNQPAAQILWDETADTWKFGVSGNLQAMGGGSGSANPAGASGYLQFHNGYTGLAADINLYWDNINKRLGLGTTASKATLDVIGNIRATSQTWIAGGSYAGFVLDNGTAAPFKVGSLTVCGNYGNQVAAGNNFAVENYSGFGTFNPVAFVHASGSLDRKIAIFQAHPSQTQSLTEWQTATGAVLGSMDKGGVMNASAFGTGGVVRIDGAGNTNFASGIYQTGLCIGAMKAGYPFYIAGPGNRVSPMLHIEMTGQYGGGLQADRGMLITLNETGNQSSAIAVKLGSGYKFWVSGDGWIGAVTGTPKAPLHVVGDSTLTGGLYLGGDATTKGTLRVDNAGKFYGDGSNLTGVNADMVDGVHGTYFFTLDGAKKIVGNVTMESTNPVFNMNELPGSSYSQFNYQFNGYSQFTQHVTASGAMTFYRGLGTNGINEAAPSGASFVFDGYTQTSKEGPVLEVKSFPSQDLFKSVTAAPDSKFIANIHGYHINGLMVHTGYSEGCDIARFSAIGTGYVENPVLVVNDRNRVGVNIMIPTSSVDIRHLNQDQGAPLGGYGVYIGTKNVNTIDAGGMLILGGDTGDKDKSAFGQISGRKETAVSGQYDGYLQFGTANSAGAMNERMRITSVGRVLIGTTSTQATGKLLVYDSDKNTDHWGNVNIITYGAAAGPDNQLGASIAFGGPTAQPTNPYVYAKLEGVSESNGTNYLGAMAFCTTSIGATVTERMRLTSAGFLGINTTTPQALLDLYHGNLRFSQVAYPIGCTATAGTAGNLNGNYYYRITFVTTIGETDQGSASNQVAAASQQVDLTNIPIGPAGTTARRIWRTPANGSITTAYQLVATINNNTATTFTDNTVGNSGTYQTMGGDNTTAGWMYVNGVRSMFVGGSNVYLGRNNYTTGLGGWNVLIGATVANNTFNGAYNTIVGGGSANNIGWGNFHVIVGQNCAQTLSGGSYSTFLGSNAGVGSPASPSYVIALGAGSNPGANNVASIGGAGAAAVRCSIGGLATPSGQLHVVSSAAGNVGLIVERHSAQTANLLELRSGDALGSSIFYVNKDQNLCFGAAVRQMINLWDASYGIGVQTLTSYLRTAERFSVFAGGVHASSENDPGTGGAVLLTAKSTGDIFQFKGNNVWHAGNLTPDTTANANTVVKRDANGAINAAYLTAASDVTTSSPSHIGVQVSSDNRLRWQTLDKFKEFIGAAAGAGGDFLNITGSWGASFQYVSLGTIPADTTPGNQVRMEVEVHAGITASGNLATQRMTFTHNGGLSHRYDVESDGDVYQIANAVANAFVVVVQTGTTSDSYSAYLALKGEVRGFVRGGVANNNGTFTPFTNTSPVGTLPAGTVIFNGSQPLTYATVINGKDMLYRSQLRGGKLSAGMDTTATQASEGLIEARYSSLQSPNLPTLGQDIAQIIVEAGANGGRSSVIDMRTRNSSNVYSSALLVARDYPATYAGGLSIYVNPGSTDTTKNYGRRNRGGNFVEALNISYDNSATFYGNVTLNGTSSLSVGGNLNVTGTITGDGSGITKLGTITQGQWAVTGYRIPAQYLDSSLLSSTDSAINWTQAQTFSNGVVINSPSTATNSQLRLAPRTAAASASNDGGIDYVADSTTNTRRLMVDVLTPNPTTEHVYKPIDTQYVATRAIQGEVYTTTLMYIPIMQSGMIQSFRICLGAKPTGSTNFAMDLRKNGTGVSDSVMVGGGLSISTGASTTNGIYQSVANIGTGAGKIDQTKTKVQAGDVLWMVITGVGNTFPGADLVAGVEIA